MTERRHIHAVLHLNTVTKKPNKSICQVTHQQTSDVRARLKPDGIRWRTGGEVKGKLTSGVGSQYSDTTLERGVSSITTADAHTSAASSRLNWRPRRFKWTRPFRRKTKSGFCACAITFQTHSTTWTTLTVMLHRAQTKLNRNHENRSVKPTTTETR